MSVLGAIVRRRALALLASAWAWGGGAGLRALSGIGAADAVPLALGALFTDQRSAAAIGAAYLRTIDRRGASREHLMRELSSDVATLTPAQLKQVIGARIRRDFAEGAIVAVDGWMLSRTEARLCALAALS